MKNKLSSISISIIVAVFLIIKILADQQKIVASFK
jgi:hypothetical protein